MSALIHVATSLKPAFAIVTLSMVKRRILIFGLTLAVGLVAVPPTASADKTKKKFQARFAKLLKAKKASHFKVNMSAKDDPANLPATTSSGMTLVASGRMGIYTPPILSASDMSAVVSSHMVDIRTCYKKQLAEDPEWADDMILDLAVKKTGRVAEVSIAPGRVKRDLIGKCLMRAVPKWKFPEFTGQIEKDLVQEVVNASFPFSFSAN